MAGDSADYFYLLNIAENAKITSVNGIFISSFIILCLLILCFFFSLCDGAINASSETNIKHIAENGEKNSLRALKIKNRSVKYSRSAQAGFTLCSVAAVIISEITYTIPLKQLISSTNLDNNWITPVSVVIISFLIALLLITFGQIIPKKLSLENPDRILVNISGAFIIASTVISPLVAVFSGLTNLILKVFGKNPDKFTPAVTEEKILMMVDEGKEKGVIEGNTKNMIENIFDFDDITVGEMMTHRKDVIAVEDNQSIAHIAETAMKSGRSRIPVYHEDIDNIVGVIYVKDLLKYVNTNAPTENIGKDIIHKAVFVPESKRCSEMFEYMTTHKTQIAIVVDEFGGTGGIITMEDLIESIVGNIQDEYDNEDDEIKKVNEYSFTVDGATSLNEITDLTGIEFESDTSDTIAGIMLERMGHIPKDGEHPSIMIDGTRFTVQNVENRRISKILVVKQHLAETSKIIE